MKNRMVKVLGGIVCASMLLAMPVLAEEGKVRAGFVVQNQTINYFLNVIKGIEDHQEEYGIETLVVDG